MITARIRLLVSAVAALALPSTWRNPYGDVTLAEIQHRLALVPDAETPSPTP